MRRPVSLERPGLRKMKILVRRPHLVSLPTPMSELLKRLLLYKPRRTLEPEPAAQAVSCQNLKLLRLQTMQMQMQMHMRFRNRYGPSNRDTKSIRGGEPACASR